MSKSRQIICQCHHDNHCCSQTFEHLVIHCAKSFSKERQDNIYSDYLIHKPQMNRLILSNISRQSGGNQPDKISDSIPCRNRQYLLSLKQPACIVQSIYKKWKHQFFKCLLIVLSKWFFVFLSYIKESAHYKEHRQSDTKSIFHYQTFQIASVSGHMYSYYSQAREYSHEIKYRSSLIRYFKIRFNFFCHVNSHLL